MKQPKIYNTALYMRLSRDDESYGDSVSIETQRTILRKFAADNGLHIVDEYVDDGWSGTNFERPSFKRMIADVDAGKVNCIVTKDLSRFGREHVMMDYYLEFVFPEKQIRYIAVTENEDTERGLSDFVPFKNLFNEWFAKDTSRKVKAALHSKFANGERIFAYAPLGYKRDPDKKNALVIDEETKWIVEKIFDMAFHGAGAASITHKLIKEQVPTPGWLNYSRYGTFANIYADASSEKQYAWTIAQVKSILKDETYIGNTIHNRQTNISYKNKKCVRKPKEEWVRVENTHEAIISRDVFEQVQEQIANRRRKMKDGTRQIFAGLIKCADCGWLMAYALKLRARRHTASIVAVNTGKARGTVHLTTSATTCSTPTFSPESATGRSRPRLTKTLYFNGSLKPATRSALQRRRSRPTSSQKPKSARPRLTACSPRCTRTGPQDASRSTTSICSRRSTRLNSKR